jgi:O-antigen ligase
LPLLAFFAIGFDYRFSAGSGPTLAVLEVVAFAALGIWFLDLVWNQNLVARQTWQAMRTIPWVMAYFVWAYVTIWMGFTRSADNLFAFRNLFPSLVICLVVIVHVRNRKDVLDCIWAYFFSVIVNLILAGSQKLFGRPYPNELHAGALIKMDLEGGFVTNTPAGFFVHPNGLAVFLIPAVILLAYGVRVGLFAGVLGRLMQMFLLIVAASVLYLTYAKGALVWAFLGLVICLAPTWARRRIGWLSACIFMVIPLIIFIGTDPFHWGIRTMNSMSTRFEIWHSALQAMDADPYVLLFGNGFRAIYAQTLRLSELPYLNAHNNVLNQVIFFGVPALALYLFALGAAVREAGVAIRASIDDRLLVCLVAVVVALVGEHFFEPVLDSVALQGQYYAFMALIFALINAQSVPVEKSTK